MSFCGNMMVWQGQVGVPDGTMTICGEPEGHLPPHRDGDTTWADEFPTFEQYCEDNEVDPDALDVAYDVWLKSRTGWDT